MNILRFEDNEGKYWVRISKAQARKLYFNGKEIAIIPCKLKPFTEMHWEFITEVDRVEKEGFDELVNAMQYYNCNHEMGKYASFYKMEV